MDQHSPASTEPQEGLRACAELLLENPARYKLFGPHWWWLKQLLRGAEGLPRKAWFRRPADEPETRRRCDQGSPALNLQAALARMRLWDDGDDWLERPESVYGIVEWQDGAVERYRLADPDSGFQLDLFDEMEARERKLRHYLDSLPQYTARSWRLSGEQALAADQPERAAVCYQRMISLAGSQAERSEAWLLLGLCYDRMRHWRKAIFCYRNLFEKQNEYWVLGNMAASHLAAGETLEAYRLYEQGLRLMPGNPELQAGFDQTARILATFRPDRQAKADFELAHA